MFATERMLTGTATVSIFRLRSWYFPAEFCIPIAREILSRSSGTGKIASNFFQSQLSFGKRMLPQLFFPDLAVMESSSLIPSKSRLV